MRLWRGRGFQTIALGALAPVLSAFNSNPLRAQRSDFGFMACLSHIGATFEFNGLLHRIAARVVLRGDDLDAHPVEGNCITILGALTCRPYEMELI